jgi:nitrate reductase NapAB chaperone NapD
VCFVIRVSRRTPVTDSAEKARRIVAAGHSTMLSGDPRHLRRVQAALSDTAGVETFLGDSDEGVVLVVQPSGRQGGLYSEKVPRS